MTDTAPSLTITEALAEIKTIGKRLESKRQFIRANLVRAEGLKDPLANQGGSVQTIVQESQSIYDLEERIVAIRRAIQAANAAVSLTIEDKTRSVADWLVWRREVSSPKSAFLVTLGQTIAQYREHARQKGFAVVVNENAASKPTDLVVHIDERALHDAAESLANVLGQLDGKLSLLNATTIITIV